MNLDLIHVHTEFGIGIFARIVAKDLGIPLVCTYHTMYEDYTHYINKFDIEGIDKVGKKVTASFSKMVVDTCEAVIAPSEKTREALVKYGVTTPIHIIPTGLDLDKFNRERIPAEDIQKLRAQYHLSAEDKVMLYVGRVAHEKSCLLYTSIWQRILLMLIAGRLMYIMKNHLAHVLRLVSHCFKVKWHIITNLNVILSKRRFNRLKEVKLC